MTYKNILSQKATCLYKIEQLSSRLKRNAKQHLGRIKKQYPNTYYKYVKL